MGSTILDDLRFRAMDYTAEQRTEDALLFIGSYRYHDIHVLVRSVAENAAITRDKHGKCRVVEWVDMSYSSRFIAEQNVGYWVTLKIRKWS